MRLFGGLSGREDSSEYLGLLCVPCCSPLSVGECHKIRPYIVESLPPTEACLRFSRTSLFIQPFLSLDRVTPAVWDAVEDTFLDNEETFPM